MKKCVFFDRDGIVNRSPEPGYVERWEDFEFLPEFANVLRVARDLGYEAIVVTNQSGVARGVVSMEAVENIHRNLQALLLDKYNLELLDILCCPHKEGECECRKPLPGMLIEAARRHNIDLKSSWMIGDQERDVEAGKRAGCRTILMASDVSRRPVTPKLLSEGGSNGHKGTQADFVVEDLKALESLVAHVLKRNRSNRKEK